MSLNLLNLFLSSVNGLHYSLLWSLTVSAISGVHFSRPLDGADIQIGSDLDNLAYRWQTLEMLILEFEIKALSPAL